MRWKIEEGDDELYVLDIIDEDTGGLVASVTAWKEMDTACETTKHNANLIAAAPRMRDTLKRAVMALNETWRFKVRSLNTDSYVIAGEIDRLLKEVG